MIWLPALVCDVYPNVLHSTDCTETKMIDGYLFLNVWFPPQLWFSSLSITPSRFILIVPRGNDHQLLTCQIFIWHLLLTHAGCYAFFILLLDERCRRVSRMIRWGKYILKRSLQSHWRLDLSNDNCTRASS